MSLIFLLIFLFLSFSGIKAHRLDVFAYYKDGKINIIGFFSDGTPCKNCKFSIEDEEGNILNQGTLDDKGQAIIPMSLKKEVYIRVNASMGHLTSFRLNPKGLPKTLSEGESSVEKVKIELTREELKRVIKEEMQEQLRPIIVELAKLREDRLSKVVSAFGYIFGLFGIFALLKGRDRS